MVTFEKKTEGKKGEGTITIEKKTGKDTPPVVSEKKVEMPAKMFDSPPATVGLKCGVTKNQGNFESIRIDVSLFLPCVPNPEDVEATFEEVKDWVDTKLNSIVEEIDSE